VRELGIPAMADWPFSACLPPPGRDKLSQMSNQAAGGMLFAGELSTGGPRDSQQTKQKAEEMDVSLRNFGGKC
jgi:hypothetical protein